MQVSVSVDEHNASLSLSYLVRRWHGQWHEGHHDRRVGHHARQEGLHREERHERHVEQQRRHHGPVARRLPLPGYCHRVARLRSHLLEQVRH